MTDRRSGRRLAFTVTAFGLTGLLAACAAQPGGGGDILQQLLGVVVSLAAVLGLAYVALRVAKRLQVGGAAATDEDLRFVRALPLGPHERLVVVVWRGERLLVGVTAGGMTLLDRATTAQPETAAAQQGMER